MPRTRISRKRTRSREDSKTRSTEDNNEGSSSSNTTDPTNLSTAAKRQRQSSSSSSNNYPLRNRISASFPTEIEPESNNNPRYNLRPRRSPPTEIPTIETNSTTETNFPSVTPPRQYRLLYISDEEDPTTSSTGAARRQTSRSTSNLSNQNRSRSTGDSSPSNLSTNENSDGATPGISHIRLNRAIEIVIDSIQSLEGVANNLDQLVFGLIYGRFNTRTDYDSIEGMIRLSRILNYNFSSRLSEAEIEALPKIKFQNKNDSTFSSVSLVEKCPICLTEFSDDEIINKLHCSHLFHPQCISTWLSENDSCPTCRRKANAG